MDPRALRRQAVDERLQIADDALVFEGVDSSPTRVEILDEVGAPRRVLEHEGDAIGGDSFGANEAESRTDQESRHVEIGERVIREWFRVSHLFFPHLLISLSCRVLRVHKQVNLFTAQRRHLPTMYRGCRAVSIKLFKLFGLRWAQRITFIPSSLSQRAASVHKQSNC